MAEKNISELLTDLTSDINEAKGKRVFKSSLLTGAAQRTLAVLEVLAQIGDSKTVDAASDLLVRVLTQKNFAALRVALVRALASWTGKTPIWPCFKDHHWERVLHRNPEVLRSVAGSLLPKDEVQTRLAACSLADPRCQEALQKLGEKALLL